MKNEQPHYKLQRRADELGKTKRGKRQQFCALGKTVQGSCGYNAAQGKDSPRVEGKIGEVGKAPQAGKAGQRRAALHIPKIEKK